MPAEKDPAIARRRIAGLLCAVLTLLFLVVAARRETLVFYAKDLGEDINAGVTTEAMQSIAGGSHSRWAPDLSRQRTVVGHEMIEHAATGGVARNEGVLHLTGLDACPT